jgi:hypothetical protein
MHVPRIVCVCSSTVNGGKCKQQVTARTFASYDYNKVLKMGMDWQVTVYQIDTSNIVCMKFYFLTA